MAFQRPFPAFGMFRFIRAVTSSTVGRPLGPVTEDLDNDLLWYPAFAVPLSIVLAIAFRRKIRKYVRIRHRAPQPGIGPDPADMNEGRTAILDPPSREELRGLLPT
jgi:hypothetical protein